MFTATEDSNLSPSGARRDTEPPMQPDPLDHPNFRLFLQVLLDVAEEELDRRRRDSHCKAPRPKQTRRKPRNPEKP